MADEMAIKNTRRAIDAVAKAWKNSPNDNVLRLSLLAKLKSLERNYAPDLPPEYLKLREQCQEQSKTE